MIDKINKVLEEDIRPLLNEDGGDIEVIEYIEEQGILKLRLRGQCSTCPQSHSTVDNLIKKTLNEKIKSLQKIVVETGLSDEMMDLAKKFLTGGKR